MVVVEVVEMVRCPEPQHDDRSRDGANDNHSICWWWCERNHSTNTIIDIGVADLARTQ